MALLRDDVLVVNAGSTSLKLTVVDANDRARQVAAIAEAAGVAAVGHRLVHGGERFIAPTRIDDDVVAALDGLRELAPLHNAPAVDAIADARRALPQIPQVAVFDTAFHATIPEVATTYLLPERFRRLGIRRYGFHGLSVAWVTEQVPAHRLVVCHLGGGCSVTAVDHGHSVDTTMGFTPLEGVPMATRAGSVDPGALLYLLRHGVGVEELDAALERDSGWQALGGTADMEELLRSSAVGARVALDVFTYRVAQAVAAMATALAGIDALAFTGGIGEHAAPVRRQICGRLGWLGIELDERANDHGTGDVAATDAPVRVHVVPAREDVMVARAVRGLLFSP